MGWSSQVVVANQVIIQGSNDGLFVYSGTPANGNLIVSAAAMAGTDPYGNTYPQGINVTTGVISGTTFKGTTFIINASGIFFYSGTPANGNLTGWWAQAAGTDSFGNAYTAGLNITKSANPNTYAKFDPGASQIGMLLQPDSTSFNQGNVTAYQIGGTPAVQIGSPSSTQPGSNPAVLDLTGSAPGGSPGPLANCHQDLLVQGNLTVNAVGQVLAAYKAAHTGRNTTTTPTADPDLQLSLAANAVYEVTAHVSYQCSTSSVDMKFTFATPTGAQGPSYGDVYINTGGTISVEDHNWNDTSAAKAIVTNNTLLVRGTLQTSSAGTFSFNWAQNTSNATNLFVNQGSHLIARRIA